MSEWNPTISLSPSLIGFPDQIFPFIWFSTSLFPPCTHLPPLPHATVAAADDRHTRLDQTQKWNKCFLADLDVDLDSDSELWLQRTCLLQKCIDSSDATLCQGEIRGKVEVAKVERRVR